MQRKAEHDFLPRGLWPAFSRAWITRICDEGSDGGNDGGGSGEGNSGEGNSGEGSTSSSDTSTSDSSNDASTADAGGEDASAGMTSMSEDAADAAAAAAAEANSGNDVSGWTGDSWDESVNTTNQDHDFSAYDHNAAPAFTNEEQGGIAAGLNSTVDPGNIQSDLSNTEFGGGISRDEELALIAIDIENQKEAAAKQAVIDAKSNPVVGFIGGVITGIGGILGNVLGGPIGGVVGGKGAAIGVDAGRDALAASIGRGSISDINTNTGTSNTQSTGLSSEGQGSSDSGASLSGGSFMDTFFGKPVIAQPISLYVPDNRLIGGTDAESPNPTVPAEGPAPIGQDNGFLILLALVPVLLEVL